MPLLQGEHGERELTRYRRLNLNLSCARRMLALQGKHGTPNGLSALKFSPNGCAPKPTPPVG